MPRSRQDNWLFNDFEKIIFGTEPGNQASIYHDGADVVFENITISGSQGPPGPPGAGVPGNVITNETGNTGIEVNDAGFIDFWQASNSAAMISSSTFVVGQNASFYNNWGSLMVKSEHTINNSSEGLKLAYFGPSGQQTMDFIRSIGLADDPSPSESNYGIGTINWSTFDYDGQGFKSYARMRATDLFADPENDIHRVGLFLEVKSTDSSTWKNGIKILAGDNPLITIGTGTPITGVAMDLEDINTLGFNTASCLITAAGVIKVVGSYRNELDEVITSISGVEHWEVFDTTISGSRVECNNWNGSTPTIDFKIRGEVVGGFDDFGGFRVGNSAPIYGILDDDELDDTSYGEKETIPTTKAIKKYVLETALAGGGSHRLLTTGGSSMVLTDNSLTSNFEMDGPNDMHFAMRYTNDPPDYNPESRVGASNFHSIFLPRSGPKYIFGDTGFDQHALFNLMDLGCNLPWVGSLTDETIDWYGKQWNARGMVSQKHTINVIDADGPSINLLGWNNYDLHIWERSWIKGPQVAFTKIGGTPSAPLHAKGGDTIGRIAFDYAGMNGVKALYRGAWIEAKIGYQNAYIDSMWLMPGGGYYPRTDWHKIENELLLSGSSYIHYGRVRIRSKLYFDDGSENFVSGIIQSEDSPCVPMGAADATNGQIVDNPWNSVAAKRRIWGLDHTLPTAQWVLDKIAEGGGGTTEPVNRATLVAGSGGYNYQAGYWAGIGQGGWHVHSGYHPGSLRFSVSGNPAYKGEAGDAFTWAARLQSSEAQTKFFLENYSSADWSPWGPPTSYFNFFRTRGGRSMTDARLSTERVDRGALASDNGSLRKGDIIGIIQGFGQARANGIDRDPCLYWASYAPAFQIKFPVEFVNDTYIGAGISLSPASGRIGHGFGDANMPVIHCSVDGTTFMGRRIMAGRKTTTTMGTLVVSRNRWEGLGRGASIWIQKEGSIGWGYEGNPDTSTLSPGYKATVDYRIKPIAAGLGFFVRDWGTTVERPAFFIAPNRKLLVGWNADFINPAAGQLIVRPRTNGNNTGITVVDATLPDENSADNAIKLYHNGSNKATINAGSNGNQDLIINTNAGKVYIGNQGYLRPDNNEGKLIVNGNIIPSEDNIHNLGLPDKRWDNVWATNGTIQVSDRREKEEIATEKLGLSFINKLKPVEFKRTGGVRKHHGLIAQDVEKTLKDIGKSTEYFAGIIHDKETDKYGLRMEEFIAPMLKAIQELSKEVQDLKEQLGV